MEKQHKICKIEGCGKKYSAKGLCKGHYTRLRKYGDPLHIHIRKNARVDAPCSVEGCDDSKVAYTFCKSHYNRWKAHGTPMGGRAAGKRARNKAILFKDGYALIELTKGAFAKVDKVDISRLKTHAWILNAQGYPAAQIGSKRVVMHRFLLDAKKGQVIDHINRDPCDNRRQNLRFCTLSQNAINRKKQCTKPSKRKSKYKGVSKAPKGHRWFAYIGGWRKKQIKLGSFPTEELAARAYDTKAKELFGEFAFLNFPDQLAA